MIQTICIPLLFIALIINIPATCAFLKGLHIVVYDENCKQEINSVKTNIKIIKIVQTVNLVILMTLMVLLNI